MTLEARYVRGGSRTIEWTADADVVSGQVIQLRDGRAGVVTVDQTSGNKVAVRIDGIFEMLKTTTMVILNGSRLFWDHSANKVHLLMGNDRDFFVGTALLGASTNTVPNIAASSAGTTCYVDLNAMARNELSLASGYASVPVLTAGLAVGAYGTGEGVNLIKDATNEAQKVDALSFRGMAPGAKGVVDVLMCVNSDSNAASDTNVGLANGTHATDADAITESLFVHLDGGSTNIALESDDGTTEVAATDTTLDYVAGTPFLVQFDLTDLSDIQAYVNGVNVLPSSVFKLNAATGPMKLLAYSEKSGTATAGNVSVLSLVWRPAQA